MPKRGSVQFLLLLLPPARDALAGTGGGCHCSSSRGRRSAERAVAAPWRKRALASPSPERLGTRACRPIESRALALGRRIREHVARAGGEGAAARPQRRRAQARRRRAAIGIDRIVNRTAPHRTAKADKDPAALGDVAISDVAIGDSITFTAADGATCVYRVTGRRVVDPHLAEGEAERADGGTSPFICSPLDRLILQAAEGALTGGKPPPAPQAADNQQKL